MAKTQRFYYRCVYPCDLGFYGPDQRRERWEQKGSQLIQPTKVLHSIRVGPSRGFNARGKEFPPDYIVTDKAIGRAFTEAIPKKVSRPSFDPETGRRNGRYFRKKISKIKFELVDADEIDSEIRRNAIDLPWTDSIYDNGGETVELPKDVAIMDKSLPEAMGSEAGDDTAESGAQRRKEKPRASA